MPKGHASRGASGMYRWKECPGQPEFCKDMESKTSPYAQEGTDAHKLAELALTSGKSAAAWLGQTIGNTKVDEEMAKHINLYLSTIRMDWPLDRREEIELKVEHEFDLDWIVPNGKLWGTNDACLCESFGKLIVYDLKYGKGVLVEVQENPQLLYYALGALGEEDYEEIEIVVVQPRAPHPDGPVRRWTISQEYLLSWAESVLKPAVERTYEIDAPLIPGDHCKFCPAFANTECPAVHEHALTIAKDDFEDITIESADQALPEPYALSFSELGLLLEKLDMIVAYSKACKAYALQRAIEGETIPGMKLVQKRATRKWLDEDQAVQRAKGYGEENIYSRKLLSPAAMEKVIKSLYPDHSFINIFGDIIEKKSSGVDLVPESDKRKPVDINDVETFDAIGDEYYGDDDE